MGSKTFARRSLALSLPLSGMVAAFGCGKEDQLEHSFIKIELRRSQAAGQQTSPYVGTVFLSATVRYETCLADFYLTNPDYGQDGILGDEIFGSAGEGWKERLCSPESGYVSCTVSRFEQRLQDTPQLTVVYDVTSDSDIEDKTLRFGPLPLASLADCAPGQHASVRMTNSISGQDANGSPLWRTETRNGDVAEAGQGGSIVIYARRD